MASKNATQATGSNVDMTEQEGNAQTIYTNGIGTFTKSVFESALKATQKAFHAVQKGEEDVKSLEQKIEERKAGNAARLILLARDCVNLTIKDGVADLKQAADLMESACSYVEAITVIDFVKRNPESKDVKIRNLVPSWPVLRSDFINAMRKASLNPADFIVKDDEKDREIPQPSAMRKAYSEWKEKNPGETDGRGRKPRTPTGPSQETHTPADAGANVATANPLTDSAKSILNNLTVAMGQLDEKAQAKAVDILTAALGEIRNLAAADETEKDKAAGVQTRRRPTPARVPESNQIAQ